MAGYSKGIADTRKLNKNNKAKLGRGGDTEIRKVDNRESHVNALEAYLIDVNGKAGEEYAKRVGAGTINPLTGMPEYDDRTEEHTHNSDGSITFNTGTVTTTIPAGENYNTDTQPLGDSSPDPNMPGNILSAYYETVGLSDDYTYDLLKDVTASQLSEFDPKFGAEDVKYFQGIFTDEPFGFLERQQDLTTRGLESAYGTAMGELGSQEKTLRLQGEGLTAQEVALGRTTGRGITQATKGAEQATRQTNMAFSGTVTQGLEAQKKQLFQDYAAGIEGIGREKAGLDISMGDIQREKGTALETLALGKDTAALDFSKGVYTEQQRQLDEYWEMIGLRQQVG